LFNKNGAHKTSNNTLGVFILWKFSY